MTKYRVSGWVAVPCSIVVEAADEEEAKMVAWQEWPGVDNYCGNGGTDKLVGTAEPNVSFDRTDGEPEWTEVSEVDEDDQD